MNKKLALALTAQADEIAAKIQLIERKMLSNPTMSDEEYDTLQAEKKILLKQESPLRRQALEAINEPATVEETAAQPVNAEQKKESIMILNTTSTASRYQIEIRSIDDDEMNQLRIACADLIADIDQAREGTEGDTDHTSIFVSPGDVGEAVRRINAAGYATDEDSED